jgi:hypothetical protein
VIGLLKPKPPFVIKTSSTEPFKTSPTVPSATGGTLYFDSNENALSYKPVTDQNDVTVNLGQESLIRIYNGLGYQINNGQVLHITGATAGIPTVALANASKLGTAFTDSLAQTSGVATHDIPSGEFGFMTNFGIVRDLNTSGFTAGQEIFLSDTDLNKITLLNKQECYYNDIKEKFDTIGILDNNYF